MAGAVLHHRRPVRHRQWDHCLQREYRGNAGPIGTTWSRTPSCVSVDAPSRLLRLLCKPLTTCSCSAQITGVGSRRVIQVASVLIMVVAVIGETAVFAAVFDASSLSPLTRLLTACCPRTRRQVWWALCLDATGDGQRPVRGHVRHHRREAFVTCHALINLCCSVSRRLRCCGPATSAGSACTARSHSWWLLHGCRRWGSASCSMWTKTGRHTAIYTATISESAWPHFQTHSQLTT